MHLRYQPAVVRNGVAAVDRIMHDLNLAARYSDQVMVLSAGEVFDQGPPEEVLTAKVIERV
jgi:iron complex transport system ATP-binding protein